MEDPRCPLVPERIEENLKMFCFLEKNKENLYVREVSMLVYADSKWFENNNYEEVRTFIRNATGRIRQEGERKRCRAKLFLCCPCRTGNFYKRQLEHRVGTVRLRCVKLSGRIAIAASDVHVQSIKHISVNAEGIMTIENKTSFQRLRGEKFTTMYLGGFANRHQIEFLKKVISDNPDIRYCHFGDIDVGGFLIHKHLCRETATHFELYRMGIEQLCDRRFSHCLKVLTENDSKPAPVVNGRWFVWGSPEIYGRT